MTEQIRVPDDERFTEPLYRIPEVAYYLRVPEGRFRKWVHGYGSSKGLVTFLPSDQRREAEIPFVGFAEGLVLRELRRKTSMQAIRKGLDAIEAEHGLRYALASRRLYTDGVELFYDYAKQQHDADYRELAEVVSRNYVMEGVLGADLRVVTFDDEGWAKRLVLPLTKREVIEVRPGRAFGQPSFIRGGARMKDVLNRFNAGDDPRDVAEDFGVPWEDMTDILRAFTAPQAA